MAPNVSESSTVTVPQVTLHRIPHPFDKQSCLEIRCMIGTGAYGRVYLADDNMGRRFAVKQLANTSAAVREINMHSRCSGHPNVLRMYGSFEDQYGLWMILEYCPDGDLFHHITHPMGIFSGNNSSVNEQYIKNAFTQICSGVDWCHKQGVYHRDLKPENVLVWMKKDAITGEVQPVLKIADFGLATEKKQTSDFGCGSTFYMSPECIGFANNTPMPYNSTKTDVWSLGILLLNMVTAQNPWRQAHPREDAFAYYQREPATFLAKLLPISEALQRCVCRALELDARKRCTIRELCHAVIECEQLRRPTLPAAPSVSSSANNNNNKTIEVNAQTVSQVNAAAKEAINHNDGDIYMKNFTHPSQVRSCDWPEQIDEQGDSGFESSELYGLNNNVAIHGKPVCDDSTPYSQQSYDMYHFENATLQYEAPSTAEWQQTTPNSAVHHTGPDNKQCTTVATTNCKKTVFSKKSSFLKQATTRSTVVSCFSPVASIKKRRRTTERKSSKSFLMFDTVRDLFVRRQRC